MRSRQGGWPAPTRLAPLYYITGSDMYIGPVAGDVDADADVYLI